jgi:NADH:ubiquinone oxidoreductase subunit 6 (subunit J)
MTKHGASIPNPETAGVLAPTRDLSKLLFTTFVYPFELTSFLILVAIIGALVLAQREKS